MCLRNLTLSLLILAAANAAGAADAQRVQFLGMRSQIPSGWVQETVTSSMRLLQFRIPDAADDAQFVLYYFGPNQGGSLEANVARWKSQFSKPDGGEVEPEISEITGAFPTDLVELEGSYARGVGMGPVGEALPERMLLAAVVKSPQGNLYPQLHGRIALVKTLRDDFIAFLEGIRPDADP